MSEPYLTYILNGRKTIEARLSRMRRPPYLHVHRDDLILFKQTSGPIVARARAANVTSIELSSTDLPILFRKYNARIVANEHFWAHHQHARYATLIELADVESIHPISCRKRDQRGWVVLAPPQSSRSLRTSGRT